MAQAGGIPEGSLIAEVAMLGKKLEDLPKCRALLASVPEAIAQAAPTRNAALLEVLKEILRRAYASLQESDADAVEASKVISVGVIMGLIRVAPDTEYKTPFDDLTKGKRYSLKQHRQILAASWIRGQTISAASQYRRIQQECYGKFRDAFVAFVNDGVSVAALVVQLNGRKAANTTVQQSPPQIDAPAVNRVPTRTVGPPHQSDILPGLEESAAETLGAVPSAVEISPTAANDNVSAAVHESMTRHPPRGPLRPTLDASLLKANAALAVEVNKRLRAERRIRKIHDPGPIPVRWSTAPANLIDQRPALRRMAGDAPLQFDGSLDEIVETYRKVPSGRLVIIGQGGAGKSTLAAELALGLLEQNGSLPTRIPVVFRLSTSSDTTMLWDDCASGWPKTFMVSSQT